MVLDKVFEPFIKEKPICVMARAVLQRILDPKQIDQLFAHTAQRQYTNELFFSTLVELMAKVVLGQEPSVHAAYRTMEEQIPVSDTSVYNKLQHVELSVSAALVRDSATRVAPVVAALRSSLPPLLPGYRLRILDGNHLAATEHRLEELRLTWAAPLPGTVLAVLDQEQMIVTDVLLTEDGQAQERSLLEEIYPLVRRGDVWVADRNFCTLGLIWALFARQGSFVLRQHGNLKGELLGTRTFKGRGATGRVYEQRLRLCNDQGEVKVVRRVTVALDQPTRDGDTEIHILTNLPAKKVSAVRVAEVYRKRWTIEILPSRLPLKRQPVPRRRRCLESACRRCYNWHSGASNASPCYKEVLHVRPLQTKCAPPSSAASPPPLHPSQLWQQLSASQRQQLCQLLSQLVARRLLTAPQKEVPHETP